MGIHDFNLMYMYVKSYFIVLLKFAEFMKKICCADRFIIKYFIFIISLPLSIF